MSLTFSKNLYGKNFSFQWRFMSVASIEHILQMVMIKGGRGGKVKGSRGTFATFRTFEVRNKPNLNKANNSRTGDVADHTFIFPLISQESLIPCKWVFMTFLAIYLKLFFWKKRKEKKSKKNHGIANFPNFAAILRPKLLLYSQELRNFMNSLLFF